MTRADHGQREDVVINSKSHIQKTYPSYVSNDTKTCPFCDSLKEYKVLPQHWHTSSTCKGPSIQQFPFELFSAALLGNGFIMADCRNPRITIESSNEDELYWWKEKLGIYGNSIIKRKDGSDVEQWETSPNFGPSYYLHSIRHSHFSAFDNWYIDGEITVPESIFPLSKLQRRILFAVHGFRYIRESSDYKIEKGVRLSVGWSGQSANWWVNRLPHDFWTIHNKNTIKTRSVDGRREASKYFQTPPEWAVDRWSWLSDKTR